MATFDYMCPHCRCKFEITHSVHNTNIPPCPVCLELTGKEQPMKKVFSKGSMPAMKMGNPSDRTRVMR